MITYYHGSHAPVTAINPSLHGADDELLCASMSVNVARRYGEVVSVFTLVSTAVKQMSLKEWFADEVSVEALRLLGFDAVQVSGQSGAFDFPVDTLFILQPAAVRFERVLSAAEILALDDGTATSHAPAGPDAQGWDTYVADLYNGDASAAVTELRGLAQ